MPRKARKVRDKNLFGNMHGHIVVGHHKDAPPGSRHVVMRTHHYDGAVTRRAITSKIARERLDILLKIHPSVKGQLHSTDSNAVQHSAEYVLRRKLGGARAYPELLARGWSVAEIASLELVFLSIRDPRGLFENDNEYVKRLLIERDHHMQKWGYRI